MAHASITPAEPASCTLHRRRWRHCGGRASTSARGAGVGLWSVWLKHGVHIALPIEGGARFFFGRLRVVLGCYYLMLWVTLPTPSPCPLPARSR